MQKVIMNLTITLMSTCLLTSLALANPSDFGISTEFELINPDTFAFVADPNDYTQLPFSATDINDAGYYFWANETRTEFTVMWTGDQVNDETLFFGDIKLYGNTFGDVSTIRFDTHGGDFSGLDDLDVYTAPANPFLDWSAWAGSNGVNYYDGFTFSINNQVMPAYITFDLRINGENAGERIWTGAEGSLTNLDYDGTFTLAAPVPEPATMLLFGTGLVGLAGAARRKKRNK